VSRNETLGKHAGASLASALLAVALGAAAPAPHAVAPSTTTVPMKKDGGVYVVPVAVNGDVTLDCIVDSGASDVNIPADVFEALVRDGAVRQSDLLGTRLYTLADGSSERGRVVRIKSLKVGNVVVHDVVASIGGDDSNGLLGQSFLGRFRSWSLDNGRHALVLVGPPSTAESHPAAGPPGRDDGPLVANDGHPRDTAPDSDTIAQISNHHGASSEHASHRPSEPDDGDLTSQDGH
jgi:clan AA aspartic protease (TIGR02281 family)